MFQLPLLGSTLQGLTKGGTGSLTEAGEGLVALLSGVDGEITAFSGELQAMLMQLSPAMLQRLDELLAGGKSLPEAARSLLGEFAGDAFDGEFADMLQKLAGDERKGGMPPPATDGGAALRSAAAVPLPSGFDTAQANGVATSLFAPATAASPGLATSMTQATMSPQLANTLLDMGVPQQVGAKGWPNAIADRVNWMVQGDQQFARLKLNPPNLGPLEVRVSVTQEQTNVAFLAQHAAVREALEAAMPRLREMFDQTSLQLVNADVSDPGAEQGHGSGRAARGFADSDDIGATDRLAEPGLGGEAALSISGVGLVDLFA